MVEAWNVINNMVLLVRAAIYALLQRLLPIIAGGSVSVWTDIVLCDSITF